MQCFRQCQLQLSQLNVTAYKVGSKEVAVLGGAWLFGQGIPSGRCKFVQAECRAATPPQMD